MYLSHARLSLGDTVYYIQHALEVKAPSISTLHYRFSKLELKVKNKLEMIVVDETGFRYNVEVLKEFFNRSDIVVVPVRAMIHARVKKKAKKMCERCRYNKLFLKHTRFNSNTL